MKTIPLQLVTLCLDNGQQGVFVGVPLVGERGDEDGGQIEDIWFSDIQDVPDELTLRQLIQLLRRQLCQQAEPQLQ